MNAPLPTSLHPDLAHAAFYDAKKGWGISHPLMIFPACGDAIEDVVSFLNEGYTDKRQWIAEAARNGDWNGWIFGHERPYRLDAFSAIPAPLGDREYWALLREVLEDTENFHQKRATWKKLLTSVRPGREYMMTEEERKTLTTMPPTLTVWRGYVGTHGADGWSWTTDYDRAEWFARRFRSRTGPSMLAEGTVHRRDVLAYLISREEFEVVVDPKRVNIKTRVELPAT